ncbi:MAG: hypothetical protein ACI9LN_003797 [Saprospiraceae bacterium]|jgi:hypothetical protein
MSGSSSITFDALNKGAAVSDYISFATDPEPGNAAMLDFSIEMRVKSNAWFSDPAIFANKNWGNGANRGFVIAGNANGSTWKFNIGDGTSRIDLNGSTINDGVWHHLTVTYDFDGTKAVYQDGVLVSSTTDLISNDVINAGNMLALGQDGTFNYGAGIGMEVADVQIYNSVLAANTIEDWSCKTLDNTHPNYADLVAHWPINDGTGTTVVDAIGSNNGLINGSNTWSASNNMTCVDINLGSGEEQRRVEIAVTAADPNLVYALATGVVNGGSGLFGVYKSTDGGETWTFNCCGPQPGGTAVAGTNIIMTSD